MTKVLTYGTYDLLHNGHIRLLERAKELGDYLIVGVTSDAFDKARGKINVRQSLSVRLENVRATGLADEILVEEYEGQKIDDIIRLGVDVFTVGSDWVGKFDYLSEYCKVVYLDRTRGVSSSELRAERGRVRLGLVGEPRQLAKLKDESSFVNGIEVPVVLTQSELLRRWARRMKIKIADSFDEVLGQVDAVYIDTLPEKHEELAMNALCAGKHVLCEAPVALSRRMAIRLHKEAVKRNLVLMPAVKTAYSTAYRRMIRLAQSGVIGNIVAVDATCTSLSNSVYGDPYDKERQLGAMMVWGPTAYLPIYELLGDDCVARRIVTRTIDGCHNHDGFTRVEFTYSTSVATMTVGKNVKSEGCLVVAGTKGYIYVPAPWWKMDYFEVRFENPVMNRRYFYQLNGEGLRDELSTFVRMITHAQGGGSADVDSRFSIAIASMAQSFISQSGVRFLM